MAKQFPAWIKRRWPSNSVFQETKGLLDGLHLNTVCQSAHCPNQGECWERKTATFMILGRCCTRNCVFCSVRHETPQPLEDDEPERVAEAVRRLGLRYAVVTSVTRDDLPDGGAAQFVSTVEAIRSAVPHVAVELLVPDFADNAQALATVMRSAPEVLGHNIETVRRLYGGLRDPRADYDRSLAVLRRAAKWSAGSVIKSGLMVGHGEKPTEVEESLRELYDAGCRAVSIGQYLSPGPDQVPVVEFVEPERFGQYEALARAIGFEFAMAGPFVRSSYRAEELMKQAILEEEAL